MYPITDAVKALFETEHKQVLRITYADNNTESATGELVTVNNAAGVDAAGLSVAINSVQSGSGDPSPENVRPITGWDGVKVTRCGKNLLKNSASSRTVNGITFTVNSDGTVNAAGTATANAQLNIYFTDISGDVKYTGCPAGGGNSAYDCYLWDSTANARPKKWDGATTSASDYGNTLQEAQIPYGHNGVFVMRVWNGNSVNIVFAPMVITRDESDTAYAPYTGETYDITFPAEAGPVYGGTLDVTTGLLTVRRAMVDDFSGLRANGQSTTGAYRYRLDVENSAVYSVSRQCASNVLTYSALYNAAANTFYNGGDYFYITLDTPTVAEAVAWLEDNSVVIVYPLTTPTIYQLDPVAVALLQGTNNLWSNAGAVAVEYHPSATITDADILMDGFNIDRYCCNGEKLEVGTAIAAELTLKLDNRDGQYNGIVFEGAELFVEVGISDWSGPNTTVNYIPCGYFTSYDQPRSLSTITIHALDRMTKFDLLPPSPMPWTDNNGNVMTDGNGETIYFMVGVVMPATIKGIVEQVCERCGITIATDLTTLPNYNFSISEMPALQTQVSYRNIIQWCAGIMGTNAWFDWNGNLRFTWYGESTSYATTTANRFNSDLYENDITITGVSYTNTQNATVVSGSADYTIDMTGNYLASAGIAQILPAVKNKVSGFTYRPFSASVINAPYLWPMDMITFVKDGVNHTCALTNVNFGINGNTSLQGKGETAQSNSGTAPSGATNEQAFLIEKAVNSAADSAANAIDRSLTQEEVFNRLTNNGEVQGLLLYNGRVYLNADYIRSGTISAQYIDTSQLHVNAANIDGTLIIGQLPSNVAVDSDLPTKVSELTNDSGYQNSTQVTTIAGNVITTAQLNADNIVTGTLNGNTVTVINLNASNIKTGVLSSVDGNTTWDLINGILQNSFHYTRYDEGSGELEADYHTMARMTGGQIAFYAMDDLSGATSYTKQGVIGATGSGVSLFDNRANGKVEIGAGSNAGGFDEVPTDTNGRIIVNTESNSKSVIWLHCTNLRVGTSEDVTEPLYGVKRDEFQTADGKTVTVHNGIITNIE